MRISVRLAALTYAILSVAFLLMSTTRAAGKDQRASELGAMFSTFASSRDPGAAVLVIKDGRIVFERGYGVTDLRSRRPIDARTNFRLASVTKQFTAASIMLLVREGKLRYENSLTDVFPDFPEYGRAITVRHLLNHTSGLADYEDLMPHYDPATPIEEIQIKDGQVLELLKQQKATTFAPGSKWAYSNSGYVLLGLVVEKISGLPFGRFLHDRIFVPLKMDGTEAYERGKREVLHRAYGHTKDPGGFRQTDQSPTSATLGDGGVYSSLTDMARWDESLRRHTLLSDAEMRPALTPVQAPDGQPAEPDGTPAAYGFGWFLNPWKGHSRMWHYGETIGFRTAIERFTDAGLTVIVLCNRADLDAGALALKVADLYLKESK